MRFVAVGLVATAIQYGVYCLLLRWAGPSVSFTAGTVVSIVCNYFMSSRITFRVATSLRRFVSFALSHALNYFVQIVLLNLFIGLGVSARLAPLPVYALAVPVNYVTVRYALTRRGGHADGYWLFLMSVGFAMLWLNLLDVPTLTDDMIYRFAWQADSSAPLEEINGLSDLFSSQLTHYASTNGRFVVHLLAQAFLVFMPPVVLQVADTLLFVLLIHLCTSWTCRDGADRLHGAALMTALLFVVFSGFRTTMVWGLGAFNYLWPTVAVMGLIILLKEQSRGQEPTRFRWSHCALLPLALLAGWSHEALSLPVSAAFAAWLVAHRRSLHGPAPACMLLFMAGTSLCVLSPGIWNRAAEGMSLTSRLLNGAVSAVTNVRVTWLLVLALLTLWRREGTAVLRTHISAHRYEYTVLAVALAIALLCGTSLERVAFYADFTAMLLLTRLLLTAMAPRAKRLLACACCVVLPAAYVPAYMVRAENAECWQKAERQMKEPGRELIAVSTPRKGESRLADLLRRHYVNSSFDFGFYCSYMGFDADDINMRCAARLYGKRRLTFLPGDVVERIESDSTAYATCELDANADLYVWRMKDWSEVKGVTFVLAEEDTQKLLPHQRLVAYEGSEYSLDESRYKVVGVGGRPYLVFTKPTTNIFRRIKSIVVKK